ncbi:DUF6612 family protein [Lysinibacillus sp. 54212]|uniref:DUF6612 family protein n=1 Tax=Lysinibacillus sp. 54212 TaxID=3119829 RepID=UPI002FC8346E
MKKKLFLGMTVGAAVLVAACGDTAEVKKDDSSSGKTTDKSELTLQQVYDKTLDRQQELKSSKVDMNMDMDIEMTVDGETVNMTSNSALTMETVISPLQFFIDGTTSMTDDSTGEELEVPMKMYMTEKDGFYLYEETAGGWLKLPNEEFEGMLEAAGMQNDATEQLKQLQQFIKEFKFEQTDDSFVLTLDAEGEKFLEFIKEEASAALGEEGEALFADLSSLTFDNAKYELTIDKKTFDLTNMVVDMVMNINEEGIETKITQSATINYYDFNSIDSITVPQDVIDTAEEFTY